MRAVFAYAQAAPATKGRGKIFIPGHWQAALTFSLRLRELGMLSRGLESVGQFGGPHRPPHPKCRPLSAALRPCNRCRAAARVQAQPGGAREAQANGPCGAIDCRAAMPMESGGALRLFRRCRRRGGYADPFDAVYEERVCPRRPRSLYCGAGRDLARPFAMCRYWAAGSRCSRRPRQR